VKVLHVTGDWKWTGPAAPMLQLLLAQRARGHEVELACPGAPRGADGSLVSEARAVGVEPVLELTRGRGLSRWRDLGDAHRLCALVAELEVDVIHTWHTRDHLLALGAAAARRRAGATRIVRSYPKAESLRRLPWNRWLFGPATDGLLCVSPATAQLNLGLRRGRPVAGAFGAVDLGSFRPRPGNVRVREALGLSPEHGVVGIVARVQRHRRFDLLMEAASRLLEADPGARLLVVGRGTHIEETAKAPAARLGISDRVVFAGYRRADYADVLRAIDVFTFLVPGSDGGCRALLEAAACAIPAVTTGRGALPEIVVHGETGLVVEEDPVALCCAWRRLLDHPERRLAMGRAARQRAESHFSPAHLADAVDDLYRATCNR
jgi:glycosyltransferase involved in cell wall biosynthesis